MFYCTDELIIYRTDQELLSHVVNQKKKKKKKTILEGIDIK